LARVAGGAPSRRAGGAALEAAGAALVLTAGDAIGEGISLAVAEGVAGRAATSVFGAGCVTGDAALARMASHVPSPRTATAPAAAATSGPRERVLVAVAPHASRVTLLSFALTAVATGGDPPVVVPTMRSIEIRTRSGANGASAFAMSAIDPNRVATSFSRQRRTTASSAGATSRRCSRSDRGWSAMMAAKSAPTVGPSNGGAPASSS
jgi:hypothetical protein